MRSLINSFEFCFAFLALAAAFLEGDLLLASLFFLALLFFCVCAGGEFWAGEYFFAGFRSRREGEGEGEGTLLEFVFDVGGDFAS